MPNNDMSIEQRHRVPNEFRQLPYSELSQFIMTKLEETKYPTPKELSGWFQEHADFYREKNVAFGYNTIIPNKVRNKK